MEFLNKLCQACQKPMNGGTFRAPFVCPHCSFQHEGGKKAKRRFTPVAAAAPVAESSVIESPAVAEAPVELPVAAEAQVESPIAEEHVEEVVYAEVPAPRPAPARQPAAVVLTTKAASEHTIVESFDEVAAECVLNLKVTPEMISDGKFIGTKSEKVRAALEQGKKHVLAQLRQKAQEQGANIVTDVAVKNSVKNADAQNVKIVVRATGAAAVAELAETSEA